MRLRQFSVIAILWMCWPLLAPARAQEPLTFLGWSDQHVSTSGDASHLLPAVDAMNNIAGTAYPEAIGGNVATPAFVFGCGDVTEWPTAAARDAYENVIAKHLKFPSYDIVGNHDEGGKSPSQTLKNWIIARHGALRYTFDKAGIHFVAAYSEYNESINNPAQPLSPQSLEFIRNDLAKLPKGRPAIVATHLCLDSITNKDDLVRALGNANVLMVLGGHYHKATVNEYRGYRFVQFPSPRDTTEFTVVRIAPTRLLAIPYDFKAKKWDENPRVRLDIARPSP